MRINEAAFVNQGNPHTAAAITGKLLALLLNDMRTARGRLAPAASFLTTVPTLPKF
jgi:ABC-type proline/glycine betaine transport system permease subunit